MYFSTIAIVYWNMYLFCFFELVWSTIFILNQSKPIALYYTYIRKDKSTTRIIFTISNTFFLHSKSKLIIDYFTLFFDSLQYDGSSYFDCISAKKKYIHTSSTHPIRIRIRIRTSVSASASVFADVDADSPIIRSDPIREER